MSWQLDPNSGTMQWVNDGVGDPSEAGRTAATNGAGRAAGGTGAQPTMGQTQHSGPGSGQAVDPMQRSNQALLARLDPSSPTYIGPGYSRGQDVNGAVALTLSNPQAQNEWELSRSMPQPTAPTMADVNAQMPQAPPSQVTLPGNTNQFISQGAAAPFARRPAVQAPVTVAAGFGQNLAGAATGPTSQNPEAGGPAEVDRANIDRLLGNVSKATSGLAGLAESDNQYSQAQAQLALGTAQAQQNALALARSGNRRDSAALGARALQANTELGAEATRSAALLRGQEEDAARRLKLDAFKAAGDLGLNSAALEVDVNNLNMQSATSYLNNLFETNRLGMQLDEAEAARVTNFVRDMALVAKDYYALSLAERQSFRDDLTRRYGINEQTKLGLQQLDSQPGFWEQAALGLVAGAGQGATAGAMALIGSDMALKEHVVDSTEAELEDLLASVDAITYDYKGARSAQGRQFGLSAQGLQRSKLGRGMVESTTDGTLLVHGGKAGLAALSGLKVVFEKLKELESALG